MDQLSPHPSRISYNGYESITTPDFIFHRFGRFCSISATTITVAAFWGILLLQFLVGGTIISALSGAPILWSVVLMAFVVAFYTGFGGFAAIYLTDLWQGIFMWIALIVATLTLFLFHGDLPSFSSAVESYRTASLENWNDQTIVALFLITIIAAFGGPDLWQRANMANNVAKARFSLCFAAIAVFFFGFIISIFTIDIRAVLSTQPSINEGDELAQYLSIVVSSDLRSSLSVELVWPEWLRILFAIGLLSAFVSTADTSAMLVATAFQNEMMRGRNTESVVLANKRLTKTLVYLACASAAFASLYTADVAEKFIAVLGILGVLGFPVFLALFGRGNKITCLFALIGGTILLVGQSYLFQEYTKGLYLFILLLPGLLGIFTRSKNA